MKTLRKISLFAVLLLCFWLIAFLVGNFVELISSLPVWLVIILFGAGLFSVAKFTCK